MLWYGFVSTRRPPAISSGVELEGEHGVPDALILLLLIDGD